MIEEDLERWLEQKEHKRDLPKSELKGNDVDWMGTDELGPINAEDA